MLATPERRSGVFCLLSPAVWAGETNTSFAEFDRRAERGEPLNVVFFGASLTWGANATDPLLTSYRGRFADRLRAEYPQAHFRFWDAAIGGTGSQLGVFRFNRDVLRHKPDLVLLDFSANDDIYSDDPETLASYESLVRRIVTEAHCPVVQAIFPFRWDIEVGTTDKMKRRDAHRAISAAYHTGLGDAIELGQAGGQAGETTLDKLWPHRRRSSWRRRLRALFRRGLGRPSRGNPSRYGLPGSRANVVRPHLYDQQPLPSRGIRKVAGRLAHHDAERLVGLLRHDDVALARRRGDCHFDRAAPGKKPQAEKAGKTMSDGRESPPQPDRAACRPRFRAQHGHAVWRIDSQKRSLPGLDRR